MFVLLGVLLEFYDIFYDIGILGGFECEMLSESDEGVMSDV